MRIGRGAAVVAFGAAFTISGLGIHRAVAGDDAPPCPVTTQPTGRARDVSVHALPLGSQPGSSGEVTLNVSYTVAGHLDERGRPQMYGVLEPETQHSFVYAGPIDGPESLDTIAGAQNGEREVATGVLGSLIAHQCPIDNRDGHAFGGGPQVIVPAGRYRAYGIVQLGRSVWRSQSVDLTMMRDSSLVQVQPPVATTSPPSDAFLPVANHDTERGNRITLFTVSGGWGLLLVLLSVAVWLAGIVDAAIRARYGWLIAIVLINFPVAIVWFLLRFAGSAAVSDLGAARRPGAPPHAPPREPSMEEIVNRW